MPPRIHAELALPSRECVEFVLGFANTDNPSEIQADKGEVWTMRDIDNAIERNRQWKMNALRLQSPPSVRDFLSEEIGRSKRNEKRRSSVLKAGWAGYEYVPRSIEVTDPEASQRRLRSVLKQFVESREITPKLDAALKKLIRDVKLGGSAVNPSIEVETLDQWWALPLAALSNDLVGRIGCCAFPPCDNYFVDWPGRRGGIKRKYCSDKHARAQAARDVRKRVKAKAAKAREKAEKQRMKRNTPGLGGAI